MNFNRIRDIQNDPIAIAMISGLALGLAMLGHLRGLPRLSLYGTAATGGSAIGLALQSKRYKQQAEMIEADANQWMLQQVETLETSQRDQLNALGEQYQKELAEMKSKVLDEFGQAGQKLKDSEKQARKEVEKLRSDLQALKLELQQTRTEKQESLDRISGNEFALRQKEQRLDFELSQLASSQSRFQDEIKAERDRLESDREWLSKENQNFEKQVLAATEQLQQENQVLRAKLAQLAEPARPNVRNNAEAFADDLIGFLYSRAILMDFVNAFELDETVHVRLKPRNDDGLKQLEKLSEAIQRNWEVPRPPTIQNGQGFIEVILDFTKATNVRGLRIDEPEANWLETAVMQEKEGTLRPNHLRLCGESESGKSALVNNILGIIKKHVPNLRVKLADPLFYAGESNWDFEPTYKDASESIEGLEAAAELVQARIDEPSLERYPLLFIQDEIDDLIAEYGERATDAIKKIWKQGRHVAVWLCVLGQSPYAKTLRMGIFDLKNAVNFFVGTTIPKGLGEFCPTDDRKEYWLKQYQARLDNGQQFLVACCPKRKQPFVAEMPLPGNFAPKGLMADLVTGSAVSNSNQFQTSSEPVLNHTEPDRSTTENGGLNQIETVKSLLAQGKRPFEVVGDIWGLKPSKSQEYKKRLRTVEALATS